MFRFEMSRAGSVTENQTESRGRFRQRKETGFKERMRDSFTSFYSSLNDYRTIEALYTAVIIQRQQK